MDNFTQLERTFEAYISLLHLVFLNREQLLNRRPDSLGIKRLEILTLVGIAEGDPQFHALVHEIERTLPVEDAIPDLHFYEVQSFFRKSLYYLDLYEAREVNSVTAFGRFLEAFRRKMIQVRYLVPIGTVDFAKRSISFGDFQIRRFTGEELNEILGVSINEIF